MTSNEIIFDNGDEAVINIASFSNCIKLKSAIARALLAQGVKLANIDLNNAETIIDSILAVDCSEDVLKAVFACIGKSTYNKERITEATFEDEKARENYYEIIIECLKLNLSPFLKPLISKLNGLAVKKEGSLK